MQQEGQESESYNSGVEAVRRRLEALAAHKDRLPSEHRGPVEEVLEACSAIVEELKAAHGESERGAGKRPGRSELAEAKIRNRPGQVQELVPSPLDVTEREQARQALQESEATYVLPDEPPQPMICANMEEVNMWLDRKRGTEEVEPWGALVSGWPQEPCN